jgi:hypothetical protein
VGAGGVVRIEAALARAAGRHSASRWGEFHEEMEKALAVVEPTLRIGKAR